MSIRVKLEAFEGPLDLLLHLIDKNKINIYDIPIVEITDQYLDYLFAMQEMNLDIASEFLLMAANLLHIKSRMLLPKRKEEAEQEEGEDPRQELTRKLAEYKKYKELSFKLRELDEEWSKVYYKTTGIFITEANNDSDNYTISVSFNDLRIIYLELLKKRQDKLNVRAGEINVVVQRDRVSIKNKMKQIQQILSTKGRFIFSRLFVKGKKSMTEIVTAFLAILILVKTGKAAVEQKRQFSDILVVRLGKNKDGSCRHGE
ncbi:MAG: segregation/condensation protein A [Clostridiaceae bacterium]|nr:segregation/condensation protein A [Clostridiaceae bacterium]